MPRTNLHPTPTPHPFRLLAAALPLAALLLCTAARSPGPQVPPAPPPAPIIAPLDEAPPHIATPAPPPAIHDDAPGTVLPIAGGVRLTFGPDRSDFSPLSDRAIQNLAGGGRANPKLVYNVSAYAAGTPEDTSTPRRLSLQRGLAVRSALMVGGIASNRIYVHALGMGPDADPALPPDRVDLTTATLDTTPPAAAPRPHAAPRP